MEVNASVYHIHDVKVCLGGFSSRVLTVGVKCDRMVIMKLKFHFLPICYDQENSLNELTLLFTFVTFV